MDSYRKRDDILNQINTKVGFEVLLVTGVKFRGIKDSEQIQQQIRPALSSHIKVDEVGDVLKDAPEKLADSIILFSQGLGMIPTARRRSSRSGLPGLGAARGTN